MSEEGGFGFTAVEKLFGLILLIVGVLSVYFTFTSMQVLGNFVGFFGFLGIVLLALGFVLLTAKTEE